MDKNVKNSKFIIREVSRLREKGYTYPEIVSNLKDRGIRSRRNKEFYKNLLVNMIMEVESQFNIDLLPDEAMEISSRDDAIKTISLRETY
jgi:hypothetical protein